MKLYLQTWSAGSEYDIHSRLSLYLTYISVADILFWQYNSHKVPSDWPWCTIKRNFFHLSNPEIEQRLWFGSIKLKCCNWDLTPTQVEFRLAYGPVTRRMSMTINRILIGRMKLMFSFHFNFTIIVSTNIW